MIAWILSGIAITGGIFNALGKRIGFWIWIIGDAGWIIYCFKSKFYAQIPLWSVFLIICIVGLVRWKQKGIK